MAAPAEPCPGSGFQPGLLYSECHVCLVPVWGCGCPWAVHSWRKRRGPVCFGAGTHCAAGQRRGRESGSAGARLRADTSIQGWGEGFQCSVRAELQPGEHHPSTSQHGAQAIGLKCQTCDTVVTAKSMSFAGNLTWVQVPAVPFTSS